MSDLYAEALSTFAGLFDEAKQSREVEPNAMTVATADTQGRPSARTVLLKAFDERGFVFYTHLDSHKGQELQANPQAALLFLWRSLREAGIQVRIEGRVEQVALGHRIDEGDDVRHVLAPHRLVLQPEGFGQRSLIEEIRKNGHRCTASGCLHVGHVQAPPRRS